MNQEQEKAIESVLPTDEKPNIGSIFDDLKERISSPFLFSFLISWVLSNWRIWIVIFLYSNKDLNSRNYDGYLDFINRNVTWLTGLIIPLVSALIYCFWYPWLRNKVKSVQAKYGAKSIKELNEIANHATVPVMKYLDLKNNFAKVEKSASELLRDESGIKEENQRLSADKIQISTELTRVRDALNLWTYWNEVSILDGDWKFVQDNTEDEWEIRNGVVFKSKFPGDERPDFRLEIKNLYANPIQAKAVFDLVSHDGRLFISRQTYNVQGNWDKLSSEDEHSSIRLIRVARVISK